MKKWIFCLAATCICWGGCSTSGKIKTLKGEQVSAIVSLPSEEVVELKYEDESKSDTLSITDLEGNSVILMRAVRDEESGEMVATESLTAAIVTARFRNIAERNGEVEIAFDITIPAVLQDDKWQIRFTPTLFVLGDTLTLDEVRITGKDYRQSQLRGYEQYEKYIASIITDPDELIYTNLLKIFIERNIPELARLEKDTSVIAESSIEGFYGVTYSQVKEYYTKIVKKSLNERKRKNKDKAFNKYVKDPFATSGIRLDSVIRNSEEMIYRYSQTLKAQKGLRKVEMTLGGSICMDGKELYRMPTSSPLSFYISSLSTFAEQKTVYVKKIIERRAQANTAAFIAFKTGRHDIIDTLFENKKELERIKENIIEIIRNEEFDLDSLVVTASCSPEGQYTVNERLALKRAIAIKEYFSTIIASYEKEEAMVINFNLSDEEAECFASNNRTNENIEIKTRHIPESWDYLKKLIINDTFIKEKGPLMECYKITDLDKREKTFSKCSDYQYVKDNLYPKLRIVRFDFFLHRKGMVKDTVHTTEIDTLYQRGVMALQERDYEKAIKYLKPYSDFNTAVALTSLDYNASALSILENLPQSAQRDYMLSIIYSRQGDEQKAVQSYVHSLAQDHSMLYRGNLDPEVSRLIKKYQINDE